MVNDDVLKEKPLVSILVPTYNRSFLLERCVTSVLAQSYSNWELIISDDGSMDDTQLIAKKLVEKEVRVCYHRNQVRKGLPINRNIAISLSKGYLIFFIEDDLVLEPDCLEILVKTYKDLKSKNIKVGAIAPRLLSERNRSDIISEIFKDIGNFYRENMEKPCMLNKATGFIYVNYGLNLKDIVEVIDVHACSLFPKNIFEEIGGYEKIYKGNFALQEDDLHFRIRNKGYNLYFQPKAVIHHKHAESGGCRVSSVESCYYFFRNAFLFRIRIFGWKSLYMIPLFLFFIVYTAIKVSIIMLIKKVKRER